VFSVFANVYSGQSASVHANLIGTVALRRGWYELRVGRQALVRTDRLHIAVGVPSGFRIDATRGFDDVSRRSATSSRRPTRPVTLRVHIVPDPGQWDIWARLVAGR
jgi:hypothetical protein